MAPSSFRSKKPWSTSSRCSCATAIHFTMSSLVLVLLPRGRSAEQVLHLHADRVDPEPPLRPIVYILRSDRQLPLLHSRRQDADVPAAHDLRQPAAEQRLLRSVHGERTTACRRRISLRSRLARRFPLCRCRTTRASRTGPRRTSPPLTSPTSFSTASLAVSASHYRASPADFCLSRALGRVQTKRISTTTHASSSRQRPGRCPPSPGSCRRLR